MSKNFEITNRENIYIENKPQYITLFYNHKAYTFIIERIGYKDFNEVSAEEFHNYIAQLNMTNQLYGKEQTFIMNATEHGCYVLTKGNSLLTVKSL